MYSKKLFIIKSGIIVAAIVALLIVTKPALMWAIEVNIFSY
jgi:hypothetical protein